ncbi:MAG: type II toxin-antitoxin system RelE/ParE family toxin [Emticicia sp.]|nr:type II toxin-antitoxin system RelE/ParE family toxin [Emticicia sp.]
MTSRGQNIKILLKHCTKKFRTLQSELRELIEELENNPKKGVNLGGGLFKIRLASDSKGGGKSGGFRVISYYIEKRNEEETIYLVTIYDKSEESSVDKDEIVKMIKKIWA